MRATLCLLLLAVSLLPVDGGAQSYFPVFSGIVGEELQDSLKANFKPSNVLNYSNARDIMYGEIDRREDSVRCIYTNHALYLPLGVDPSTHLYMNGISDGINAEHSYPSSKGASAGQAKSNLHHLFPSRTGVNSARSNFPFAEIDDSQTTSWYIGNTTQSGIPSASIELYSEKRSGQFEPREDVKGNIARGVFYFYTMYTNEAMQADPDFFESQRETLYHWHLQDPVDSLEWERTYAIADYQDGLPNPFILDCGLVERVFGQEFAYPFPADINRNGEVDVDDFVNFNSVFGSSCGCCAEDINKDGIVDVNDYLILNGQFGEVVE